MLKLDIEVHPSFSEPKIEAPPPEQKGQKWRFPWRIKMLALPKYRVEKYHPPLPRPSKVFGPLDPATEFRSDHLARPALRLLNTNLRLYNEVRGPKYVKIVTKTIDKSWNSIYNYYRKKLREKALKRLKRKLDKKKAKKPTGKALEKIEQMKKEKIDKMAQPKKIPQPEKIPRKWKPLEDLLTNIDTLASPKEYHIVPPRPLGYVNPKALEYEITEQVMKLYSIPERMKQARLQQPLIPGEVKRAALRAKCTERIEKLAQPSFSAREAKKQDEDKYDPWQISPNALKYKPSARILELAKPTERE